MNPGKKLRLMGSVAAVIAVLLWWSMIGLLPEQVKQQLSSNDSHRPQDRSRNSKEHQQSKASNPEEVKLMPRIVKPEPRKASTRKQSPKQASKPTSIAATRARSAGARALKSASMPSLEGDIDMPFEKYLAHVRLRGGVLAVFNRQNNRVVGQIRDGRFSSRVQLGRYARRTRDVTPDLPASLRRNYLRMTEQAVGKGAYRFLIMMPEDYEQRFIGTLALLLKNKGLRFAEMDAVHYRYRRSGQRLLLEVLTAEQGKRRVNIQQSSYL